MSTSRSLKVDSSPSLSGDERWETLCFSREEELENTGIKNAGHFLEGEPSPTSEMLTGGLEDDGQILDSAAHCVRGQSWLQAGRRNKSCNIYFTVQRKSVTSQSHDDLFHFSPGGGVGERQWNQYTASKQIWSPRCHWLMGQLWCCGGTEEDLTGWMFH